MMADLGEGKSRRVACGPRSPSDPPATECQPVGAWEAAELVGLVPDPLILSVLSPCSEGGTAHRTPAHPQWLLHHQPARQKRCASVTLTCGPAPLGCPSSPGPKAF